MKISVLNQEGLGGSEVKETCLHAYRYQTPDIHLYEGVREMVESLRQAGVKIGIITDGRLEGQWAKIKALGLEELTDSILVTDELGGVQFRKPNDIAFRIMQMRLNVPFDQMLYVGDNVSKDFQAPKLLGMQWVYFYNKDGLYCCEHKSDENCVASIADMSELLGNMI